MGSKGWLTVALACLFLSGCASSGGDAGSAAAPQEALNEDFFYRKSVSESNTGVLNSEAEYGAVTLTSGRVSGSPRVDADEQKKVIVTGSMDMESGDFDHAVTGVRQTVAANGGYMEYASVYSTAPKGSKTGKELQATIKIPAEQYESARRRLAELGTVTTYEETAEDATAVYTDTESRLNTKLIEEERVLALIDTAVKAEGTSIEDILALEARLGMIREEIEHYDARLRAIDTLTAYSTLRLLLSETAAPEAVSLDPNLSRRMADSFNAAVQALINVSSAIAVFCAAAAPPLIIAALICAAVMFVTKKLIPKLKARKPR